MKNQTRVVGAKGDDGFTLVELLLTIVIIGVITVPLANVVIGYLRNTDKTTARLLASHDVQIASAYWAQDIASIGQRDAQGDLQSSIQTPDMTYDEHCKSKGTVAEFTWDDFPNSTDPATVVTVAYVVTFDPSSKQCQLHRHSTSPASDVVLVHNLYPLTPQAPPACSTTCTAVPTAGETVTLDLILTDPGSPDGFWHVQLIGQRRGSS